jgi:hypothetical protein
MWTSIEKIGDSVGIAKGKLKDNFYKFSTIKKSCTNGNHYPQRRSQTSIENKQSNELIHNPHPIY